MCIGPRAENHALVDDVDGLPADIEQHDADDQPCDRRIAERERQPRTREQHERGAGRRFAAPAIREPARAGGGCRTQCADEAERTDLRMRHRVRRCAQRQHQCAPEDAEGREHQQRDRATHAQHAFIAQQRHHRLQQRRVADALARAVLVRQ